MSHLSSSFQEAANDFETKVQAMINGITQKVIPLQKKSYECCVKCFSNNKEESPSSLEVISRCIQDCQANTELFGSRLGEEMRLFQEQISGCQQACHSKYSMPFNEAKKQEDKNKIQTQLEECASKCFTEAVPQIAEIKRRMMDVLQEQLNN